jgi:hypothetical protein
VNLSDQEKLEQLRARCPTLVEELSLGQSTFVVSLAEVEQQCLATMHDDGL